MFKSPLSVTYLGGKWWRLNSPLKYGDIIVPAGFVTDKLSMPRLPGLYWLFGNRAHRPAVVHDLLYRWGTMPRKQADKMFLAALKDEGYGIVTRYALYWSVRLFSFPYYREVYRCLDDRFCSDTRYSYCETCPNFFLGELYN